MPSGPSARRSSSWCGSIRAAVGSRARIVHVPGGSRFPSFAVLGLALHDVLLTKDEYRAMADGLADTDGPATGHDVPVGSGWPSTATVSASATPTRLERHFGR